MNENMITYKYKETLEIKRPTNLVITDPLYLDDIALPIYSVNNKADGLYDMRDDNSNEVIGTVGVDCCEVGVFVKKHIPKKDLMELQNFLYTEIPKFKGKVRLYTCDYKKDLDDGRTYEDTYFLLEFDGKSNSKDIRYSLQF